MLWVSNLSQSFIELLDCKHDLPRSEFLGNSFVEVTGFKDPVTRIFAKDRVTPRDAFLAVSHDWISVVEHPVPDAVLIVIVSGDTRVGRSAWRGEVNDSVTFSSADELANLDVPLGNFAEISRAVFLVAHVVLVDAIVNHAFNELDRQHEACDCNGLDKQFFHWSIWLL